MTDLVIVENASGVIEVIETSATPSIIEVVTEGQQGELGASGIDGLDGVSAYQVAVNNGFIGSEIVWLASLKGNTGDVGLNGTDGTDGKSAYQLALDAGFVGTEAQWLISLIGAKGDKGDIGNTGLKGDTGDTGLTGQSAYEAAVTNGFVGTMAAWLLSLKGDKGDTGATGASFTVDATGLFSNRSTYDAELAGFSYLATDTGNLYIREGASGWSAAIPFGKGDPGINGTNGIDGTNGVDGTDGAPGANGLSAYQIAVNGGFVGTEAAWIASLEGAVGPAGADGAPGATTWAGITDKPTFAAVAISGLKADVGLGNVDNTSDASKPVSTATQTALDAKQDSLGYTPASKAGDTFTGPVAISSITPVLNFIETDQTLPAGKFRIVVSGDIVYLQKNTAAAGDFSTATIVWSTDVSGGLTATTPATSDNDTSVATTAYTVARIAQDAPSKTGAGASGSWDISVTGNAENVTGIVAGANGGTGVANTGKTLTLGGNHVNSGAFASTFTFTGVTTVTFPTSGTLSTLTGAETLTNKTLTAPVINSPTGIVKANVGLSNVDNTSDASKPISTATQTALDAKQATLVSGTNLNTVNGVSLLGATDLEVGYRDIPQNSKSAAYTLVLADRGKNIYHPSADTTARTFTIPANSSVAYPVGTTITFTNDNGAGVLSIAITTDTMRLAGAGTTGTRTLAANGIATATKLTATSWIISGTGLT